ncbi:TapY2 family type IVa secretion system protein [Catenovulum sediminis]|uniref:TapY2 family type IVa secretion system protein n=1 Tax=Catenovulum sediminis TaxID=1740262 RepID=A0ABV1RN61_9ALTE|nr:TapY2 family type IVa secretion system protein [Catenovulum sediminis]
MEMIQRVCAGIKLCTLPLLLIAGFSASLSAQPLDYKCYVQLNNGKFQIAFIDGAHAADERSAMQVALAQGVYAEDGTSVLKINKVFECRRLNRSFVNVEAIKLDERTPR